MDDRSEFIHVANKLVRLIQNQKNFSKFGRVLVRNWINNWINRRRVCIKLTSHFKERFFCHVGTVAFNN